jgi:methionyl-tRNA formyltransferase
MAAESIHTLVRGLARPYAGAHFDYGGSEVKVWKAKVDINVPLNLEPGKVLAVTEKDILVKTGVGAIRLQEIWPRISVEVGSYL